MLLSRNKGENISEGGPDKITMGGTLGPRGGKL